MREVVMSTSSDSWFLFSSFHHFTSVLHSQFVLTGIVSSAVIYFSKQICGACIYLNTHVLIDLMISEHLR